MTQGGIEKKRKENNEEIIIEKKDIDNIVLAKRTYNTGAWSKEIETNFFISLRTIAQVIDPVSVQSIKSIYNKEYFSLMALFKVFMFAVANIFISLFTLQ